MAIVKEERIGDQRLILGDCLAVMPLLGEFDAVVTDPPYGIGEGGDKNRSRGKVAPVGNYKSDKWDCTTADVQIKLAIQMSKSAIVFGGKSDQPFLCDLSLPGFCYLTREIMAGRV